MQCSTLRVASSSCRSWQLRQLLLLLGSDADADDYGGGGLDSRLASWIVNWNVFFFYVPPGEWWWYLQLLSIAHRNRVPEINFSKPETRQAGRQAKAQACLFSRSFVGKEAGECFLLTVGLSSSSNGCSDGRVFFSIRFQLFTTNLRIRNGCHTAAAAVPLSLSTPLRPLNSATERIGTIGISKGFLSFSFSHSLWSVVPPRSSVHRWLFCFFVFVETKKKRQRH